MNSIGKYGRRIAALVVLVIAVATSDCWALHFMMVDAGAGGYERNGVHIMFDANQGDDTIAIITATNQRAPTGSTNPFVCIASRANSREGRAGTNERESCFFALTNRTTTAALPYEMTWKPCRLSLTTDPPQCTITVTGGVP